ncbi:MAG: asparagine synthase (glutamine-hydrolyzing) [Mesorhizobium amorphae]|nr:MAG: asparagine synthase (glutamine-hydrolyzing) [Mesorhizobium amorphae]
MCGIAGFCGNGVAPDAASALLRRMTGSLAHRGPDAEGVYVAEGAGLGHRRLSVVGVEDGSQPMRSAETGAVISYNGEVFNYLELRRGMEARGRVFRTGSDTEVVLALYDEKGPDCVSELNGDFAFAIWDERCARMMLARDRMGVRPLFMAWRDETLFFASEPQALLFAPGMEGALDIHALDQIFSFWAPLGGRTAFRNISELPPGHLMLAEGGRAVTRAYWRLDYPPAGEERRDDERVLADELLALLDDATAIRLRADVPVGSYLSGGLDSSVVASLAARHVSDRLKTFSVSFDDPAYDESAFQERMSAYLGTAHASVAWRGTDTARVFADVVAHAGQPILRTAPAPLFGLAALVRDEGFKVVLTGEGSDEIFAGYDLFAEARVRRFAGRMPGSTIRPHLFRKLYPYLPALRNQPAETLAAFFGIEGGDDPLFSHRPRMRNTAAAKLFFSAELRAGLEGYDAADELAASLPAGFGSWHPLNQAQYLESTLLLPGYILSAQGDRMALGQGVETRFPFLDHRLVEWAARLAPEHKLKGLSGKHILKRAAARIVPPEILARTKQPYRAPESAAFREAPALVSAHLGPHAIANAGLFNPRPAARLVEKCMAGQASGFRDNAAFVGMLSTQIWLDRFARSTPAQPVHAAAS